MKDLNIENMNLTFIDTDNWSPHIDRSKVVNIFDGFYLYHATVKVLRAHFRIGKWMGKFDPVCNDQILE